MIRTASSSVIARMFALLSFELVPGEGLEPPTNGLQNRCSTAELTRRLGGFVALAGGHCHGLGGKPRGCSAGQGERPITGFACQDPGPWGKFSRLRSGQVD